MPVMKICPKCGGENASGFAYCGKCGAPLNDVPAVNLTGSQTTPPDQQTGAHPYHPKWHRNGY